ncbi:MAG: YqaE/Pmp3 family membrane protein [Bacteroidota bacterium]
MRKKILIFAITFIQLTVLFAAVPVIESKKDSATAFVSKDDEAMVKNAVAAFKSLSKKERKTRIADAKELMKNYRAEKAAGDASSNTVLLAILAILLPPLAVYLHEDAINTKFWISLILTLLFWIPGVIYALIVVLG